MVIFGTVTLRTSWFESNSGTGRWSSCPCRLMVSNLTLLSWIYRQGGTGNISHSMVPHWGVTPETQVLRPGNPRTQSLRFLPVLLIPGPHLCARNKSQRSIGDGSQIRFFWPSRFGVGPECGTDAGSDASKLETFDTLSLWENVGRNLVSFEEGECCSPWATPLSGTGCTKPFPATVPSHLLLPIRSCSLCP